MQTAVGERTGIVAALALCVTAYALFTFMDTIIKILAARYHVVQLLFFNALFAFATVTSIAAARGNLLRVVSVQWRMHLLRWAIGIPGGIAIFWCYGRMPLADVYAILFTAPLFMTALSVPFLGEQVGWRRWTAVCVGFAGVLVILAPGSGALSWAASVALIGALVHASNMLLLRRMRGIDPPEVFGLYGNGLSTIVMAGAIGFVWITPTATDLGLHAIAGIVAGSGFMLLVQAYAKAAVAILAPLQYVQLVFGILIGLVYFGDVPDSRVLVGSAIVVASGLFIFHRETVLARQRAP